METRVRKIEVDEQTAELLEARAAARGVSVTQVVADAVELLDSITGPDGLDIEEDRRRLRQFGRTREAIPLDEVVAWTESWGAPNELPPPKPRKIP
jgi:hypothetical protein